MVYNNLDIWLMDLASTQLVKALSDQRNLHQAWTVAPIDNLTSARLNSKQMRLILEVFKMNQEREGMGYQVQHLALRLVLIAQQVS